MLCEQPAMMVGTASSAPSRRRYFIDIVGGRPLLRMTSSIDLVARRTSSRKCRSNPPLRKGLGQNLQTSGARTAQKFIGGQELGSVTLAVSLPSPKWWVQLQPAVFVLPNECDSKRVPIIAACATATASKPITPATNLKRFIVVSPHAITCGDRTGCPSSG